MRWHEIVFHSFVNQLAFLEHLLFAKPRAKPWRERKAKYPQGEYHLVVK